MSVDVEMAVREYIDKSVHMSLATVSANKPWVCEVHFAYDDSLNVYIRSERHRRHCQEIADNPNVAGNIVAQHSLQDSPHGIYFEGQAELIEDEIKYSELYGYFEKRQDVTEEIIEQAKTDQGPKFYKITVDSWYAFGVFNDGPMQKYHLAWNGGKI